MIALSFTSGSHSYQIHAYVFDELSHTFILGLPFLYKYKVTLDFFNKRMFFDKPIPAATVNTVLIPPGHSSIVSLHLRSRYDIPDGAQGVCHGLNRRNGLQMIRTATTCVGNRCLATFKNNTLHALRLAANTILGHFTPTSDPDFASVDRSSLPPKASVAFQTSVSPLIPSPAPPRRVCPLTSTPTPLTSSAVLAERQHLISEYNFDFDKINLSPPRLTALQNLLFKYKSTFVDSSGNLGYNDSIYHTIKVPPHATPVCRQPYRMPPEVKDQLRKQIAQLVRQNVLKEELSEWALPLLAVRKGVKKSQRHMAKPAKPEYRLVVDFRELNSLLIVQQAALASIQDIIDEIGASKPRFFTVLDLKHGYFQMALDPKSRKYTGFIFDRKSYVHVTSPMGLKSSPFQFQQLMFTVLEEQLKTGKIFSYLDDLLITGSTFEEHMQLLESVLAALERANLKLGAPKCEIAKTEVDYLGYTLNANGIMPSHKHVEALASYPRPRSLSQLKTFLGLVNFFSNFLRDRAIIIAPFLALLKKDVKFSWSDQCQNAFETVIQALTSQPILAYADNAKPFTLITDASSHAIGGVLLQHDSNNELRPIAYAGRACNVHERNYHATESEALAIVFCVKKWHYYLATNRFTIFSDHAALRVLTSRNQISPKLARYAEFLGNYDFELKHIKGTNNSAADALSRRPYHSINLPKNRPALTTMTTPELSMFSITPISLSSPPPLQYRSTQFHFSSPDSHSTTSLQVYETRSDLVLRHSRPSLPACCRLAYMRSKKSLTRTTARLASSDILPISTPDTCPDILLVATPLGIPTTKSRDLRSLSQAYRAIFQYCREHNINSLCLPLLGSTSSTLSQTICFQALARACLLFFRSDTSSLLIHFDLQSTQSQSALYKAVKHLVSSLPLRFHKFLEHDVNTWCRRLHYNAVLHLPSVPPRGERRSSPQYITPVQTRAQTTQQTASFVAPPAPRPAFHASATQFDQPDFLSTNQLIEAQQRDEFLGDIRALLVDGTLPPTTSRKRRAVAHENNYTVQDNLLYFINDNPTLRTAHLRVAIPAAHTIEYVKFLHCSDAVSHLGIDKTFALVRERAHFKNIFQTVSNVVNSCIICASTKARNRPIRRDPELYELASQPFERCHLDHAVFDMTSSLFRYVASCVDATSGYIIAWPCKTLTAQELARGFYTNVVLRFGAPKKLITDNAPNFRSQFWADVAKELGISHSFISPYTSRSNGMAEVSIRSLRSALSSMQMQTKKEWDFNLPAVIFSLNNTVNRHTGYTPHHIIFGRAPRLLIDNVAGKLMTDRPLNEVIAELWSSQLAAQNAAIRTKEKVDARAASTRPKALHSDLIKPGTVVFWQKKNLAAGPGSLAPKFFGPYKVLTCDRFTAYLQHLETGESPHHRVNVEQLKPFHFVSDYMTQPHYSKDDVYRAQPNPRRLRRT